MSDTEIRVKAIQEEALAIVRAKNDRYGSSWRNQGWLGNTSRILEKSDRLRAMLWNNSQPLLNGEKEHPRETMLDLMNTLAFAIINMDDGVERGNEPQAKDILGPWMAGGPTQHENTVSDFDRARHEYAHSIGRSVESLFAEEWPAHLRKDTDRFGPAMQGLIGVGDPNEITITDLPVPGEEQDQGKPSPRPRGQVTDRGSGPRRRVKDAPQA